MGSIAFVLYRDDRFWGCVFVRFFCVGRRKRLPFLERGKKPAASRGSFHNDFTTVPKASSRRPATGAVGTHRRWGQVRTRPAVQSDRDRFGFETGIVSGSDPYETQASTEPNGSTVPSDISRRGNTTSPLDC